MGYKLVYTKTSAKGIQKLDKVTKRKIKQKIEAYSKKPYAHSRRLINSKLGSFRWRIGNYRVVFDMDGKKIVILRIGHRREVYK